MTLWSLLLWLWLGCGVLALVGWYVLREVARFGAACRKVDDARDVMNERGWSDEIELPTWTGMASTWSDAEEVAAERSYDRALREWQQSVELPLAKPFARSGVRKFRRDFSKPVKLTQAEAEHVRMILFPSSAIRPRSRGHKC